MSVRQSPGSALAALRRHPRLAFAGCAAAMVAAYAWIIPWHARQGFGPLPDWTLALDMLVVLPLVWLWLQPAPRGRSAWLGALAVAMAGIWVGAWLLPPESKQVWLWLEPLRWGVLGLLILGEGVLVALAVHGVVLVWRQRRQAAQRDHAAATGLLETAVHACIAQRLGEVAPAALPWLQLEGRMWLHALMPTRDLSGTPPPGERWFSVHRQGQNASNQLGFVILAGVEIPIAHALLHLWAGPWVAGVVTALSVWGWIFLFADWRASLWRPISVSAEWLHLRHGLLTDVELPRSAIVSVQPWSGELPRADRITRRNRLVAIGMGRANLRLTLAAGTEVATLTGRRTIHEAFIGVDEPERLRAALAESP